MPVLLTLPLEALPPLDLALSPRTLKAAHTSH